MRRVVLTALGLLAASAGAAAAKPIVIAEDPPPPPYELPVAPTPDPPRRATIAFAAASMAYVGDTAEPLARFGPGGELGLIHMSHREDPGFELLARTARGERGVGYAASVRLLITKAGRDDAIAPFLALGAAFAIDRLDGGDDKMAVAGMGLGPSAAIGLHGFLTPTVYWRAQAQMVGAGIGMFTTDVGLGWVVGR